MLKKSITLAALGAALALFAACGGGEGKSGAGTTASHDSNAQSAPAESKNDDKEAPAAKASNNAKACELLSDAQVAAAMGEAMKPGITNLDQVQGRASRNQCAWLAESTKSKALASLFLHKSTEKETAGAFERNRKTFADAVAVEGLPGTAYFVPSLGQLNVLNGDAWFIITANRDGLNGERAVTDAHRTLAELALKAY